LQPLIADNEIVDDDVDNPFTTASLSKDISLSVFSQPEKIARQKEIPKLTQETLLKNVKGYKPQKLDKAEEEGTESPTRVMKESILPEMSKIGIEMITKDGADQWRQDQL